jgi:hypothetical protein
MKLMTVMTALAVSMIIVPSAQARERHHHHHRHGYHHYARHHASAPSGYAWRGDYNWAWRGYDRGPRAHAWSARTAYRGGLGGRPRAWCGWQMRQLVGSDPGPSYNLARNWAHWGRSGPAGIGAVVVWAHHVGKIVGRENGMWVIESGNDGHRLRTRPRSIAGAIAIRWG